MATASPSAPPPPQSVLPQTAEAVRDGAVPAAATDVATHESTEPAHGESGGGLPQFELEWWGGQIVWLLIIFAVLYVLLAKVFLPRLRGVQDERASTIANAVAAARQVQDEAGVQAETAKAEVNKARADARATAAAAKARTAEDAARRQAAEEAEVAGRIAEAETAIRRTRDAAMTNVSTIAAETAQAMVERLTGGKVNAADAAAAVKGAA